jgi:hypothetical protein
MGSRLFVKGVLNLFIRRTIALVEKEKTAAEFLPPPHGGN